MTKINLATDALDREDKKQQMNEEYKGFCVEQKDKGNVAFKGGNCAQANQHFSNSIDVTTEKEFLKIIYSDRCAARLKLKQNNQALHDAQKCIELDSKSKQL